MSDFLARLAARQLGTEVRLEPKLPSRFAPADPVWPETAIAREPGRRIDVRIATPRPIPVQRQEGVEQPAAPHGPPWAPDALVSPHVSRAASSGEHAAPDASVAANRRITTESAHIATPPRTTESRSDESADVIISTETAPEASVRPLSRPLVRRSLAAPIPRAPVLPPRDTSPRSPTTSEPMVRVTIGRIEVRAIMPPQPAKRVAPEAPKALSLEDYLERRHGGRR